MDISNFEKPLLRRSIHRQRSRYADFFDQIEDLEKMATTIKDRLRRLKTAYCVERQAYCILRDCFVASLLAMTVNGIVTQGKRKNKGDKIKRSEIIGTWKFESMVVKTESGKTVHPYGEKLCGILIYTPSGYMSALLMNPDRKKFASDDLKTGTPEEIKQAYEKFDAYCGTYTVDESKGTVTHHVEGAKFPNWVGTDQVRYFELKGDRLQIKATIEIEGEAWHITAALRRT